MKPKFKIGQFVCLDDDANRLYRILDIKCGEHIWYIMDEPDSYYTHTQITINEQYVNHPPITELFKAGVNDMVAL